jgi:hypothetical protein
MKKFAIIFALLFVSVTAQAAQIDESRSYDVEAGGQKFKAYCLYNGIDPVTGEKYFDWQFVGRNGFLPKNPDYQKAWPKIMAAAWVLGKFGYPVPEDVWKDIFTIAQTDMESLPKQWLAKGQKILITVSGEPKQTRKRSVDYDTDFGVTPNTVVQFDAQLGLVRTITRNWKSKAYPDGSYELTKATFALIKPCENDLTILAWDVIRIYPEKGVPEELPTDEPDEGNPIPPPPPAKKVLQEEGMVLNAVVSANVNNTPQFTTKADGTVDVQHGPMEPTQWSAFVDGIYATDIDEDPDTYNKFRARVDAGALGVIPRDGQDSDDVGVGTNGYLQGSAEWLYNMLDLGVTLVATFGPNNSVAIVPKVALDPDGFGLCGEVNAVFGTTNAGDMPTMHQNSVQGYVGLQLYGERSAFAETNRLSIGFHYADVSIDSDIWEFESQTYGIRARFEHVFAKWGSGGSDGIADKNVAFVYIEGNTGPVTALGKAIIDGQWVTTVDSDELWDTSVRAQVGFRFWKKSKRGED